MLDALPVQKRTAIRDETAVLSKEIAETRCNRASANDSASKATLEVTSMDEVVANLVPMLGLHQVI